MYGWWSDDYLIKNSNVPIYTYTSDSNSNIIIVATTVSNQVKPDNIHKWIGVGNIYKLLFIRNYNNYESSCSDILNHNKKQKKSEDIITFTNNINYGWYSQEFVNKNNNNFINDKNNNFIKAPKNHKYLTPTNTHVFVSHETSNINNEPQFSDVYFVGEMTKYLETISFN